MFCMVRRRSPRLQRRTQAAADRLWQLAETVSLWAHALGLLVAPVEERCGSSRRSSSSRSTSHSHGSISSSRSSSRSSSHGRSNSHGSPPRG